MSFVLFDLEEVGLHGSATYVARASDREMVAMLNVDMVSYDGDGDGLVELHTADGALPASFRSASTHAGLDVPIHVGPGFGGDDHFFTEAGIPAASLIEGWSTGDTTPHYHRATDVFERVQLDYLATATRLMLQVLAERLGRGPS